MSSDPNYANQAYEAYDQQEQTLNLPKVRQTLSRSGSVKRDSNSQFSANVAPATPRMLRTASNSTNLSDEYTINPEFMGQQRTPSKRITITSPQQQHHHQHQRQSSNQRPSNLLPGVDFNTVGSPSQNRTSRRTQSISQKHGQPSVGANSSNSNPHSRSVSASQQAAQVPSNHGISSGHQNPQQQQQFHRKAIGDWEFAKTIGAGSMGKVKLAKHRITNEVCAVKVVPRAAKIWQRQHINDPPTNDPHEIASRKKEFEKEVARDKRTIREGALGRILYHPYICRLYEMFPMTNHYYMLFEYVSGGQMLDYIVSHGSLKESQARKFCRGIASALDYCHSNNIVHRDLKIENIMINKNGEIKIIDFGLSNMFDREHLLKTYCGSLYFAAPELLSAHPYIGPEVDIWSFGVVLFVLVCGKVPFDDKSVSALHEKIKKGHVEYPDHLSHDCVSLLCRMLVVDPTQRASLKEVMNHPWMTKGFGGPPPNYLPNRIPLELPLNHEVISTIVELDLGSNEEQVIQDLTKILLSPYYIKAVKNWYNKKSGEKYDYSIIDPTCGVHPLVSIYYLVDEMLQRRKIKFEEKAMEQQKQFTTPQLRQNPIFNATSIQPNIPHESPNRIVSQPVPQQYQHKKQFTPGELAPPVPIPGPPPPPPILTFPQAAYTSPHQTDIPAHSFEPNRPSIETSNIVQQQSTPPPPQQSPQDTGFTNSLFRRLSSKKSKNEDIKEVKESREEYKLPNDDIRRVGSVKVTSKEKQLSSAPPLPPNSRKQVAHHQRAVSAYTTSAFMPDNQIQPEQQITKISTDEQPKKYHPSARAKSLSHARKHSLNFNKSGNNYTVDNDAPPLPQITTNDEFFDDDMDDVSFNKKCTKPKKLSDKEIIAQFANAAPGTMPSIEYPKTLFLKGFFSVQTTSTKPLPIIRYDIISVLPQLGVQFLEVKGGFICVHYPSIVDKSDQPQQQVNSLLRSPIKAVLPKANNFDNIDESLRNDSTIVYGNDDLSSQKSKSKRGSYSSTTTTERSGKLEEIGTPEPIERTPSFNPILVTPSKNGHRRKFSLGNGLLGRKGEKLTVSTNMLSADYNIPTTPAPANVRRSSEDSSESLTLDESNGASDMLVSSRLEQQNRGNRSPSIGNVISSDKEKEYKSSKTPLKFEIHIVKVPLVGLYGIQFKKVSGNTWLYKSLASEILSRLNL